MGVYKMNIEGTNIKKYILLPVILVIVILLIALVVGITRLQYNNIHKQHAASLRETEKFFQMELDEETQLMDSLIDFLKRDKTLQDAWLAKNRKALLDHAAPSWKRFTQNIVLLICISMIRTGFVFCVSTILQDTAIT